MDVDSETKSKGKNKANENDQDIDDQEPSNEGGREDRGGESSEDEAAVSLRTLFLLLYKDHN